MRYLSMKYASAELSEDDVERCLYSISDHNRCESWLDLLDGLTVNPFSPYLFSPFPLLPLSFIHSSIHPYNQSINQSFIHLSIQSHNQSSNHLSKHPNIPSFLRFSRDPVDAMLHTLEEGTRKGISYAITGGD